MSFQLVKMRPSSLAEVKNKKKRIRMKKSPEILKFHGIIS